MKLPQARQRIDAIRTQHRYFDDLLLAVTLAVFAELDVLLSGDWRGTLAVNAAVVPLLALSLAWRRSRPTLVLAVVIGGFVALSAAYGSSQTWSSIFITLVAVYSAAAHGWNLTLAATITAVGTVLVTLNDPAIDTFGEALWSSTLLGLTFLVGLTGRAMQDRGKRLAQRAEAFDQEQANRAAEAVEEERRRIARELHDIVSHSLAVLVLQAGAVEQVVEKDPRRARDMLRSMRETGQVAMGEMGTLLGLIRGGGETSRQPQPSLSEIDALVRKMEDAGMHIDVEVEGERRALPPALELSAYRIVQEGLTNSLRHSGTAAATVVLRYGDERFEVEIVDNGRGGDAKHGGRRGLVGVRERVAVFGGQIEVGPRAEGGWALRAAFPLAR